MLLFDSPRALLKMFPCYPARLLETLSGLRLQCLVLLGLPSPCMTLSGLRRLTLGLTGSLVDLTWDAPLKLVHQIFLLASLHSLHRVEFHSNVLEALAALPMATSIQVLSVQQETSSHDDAAAVLDLACLALRELTIFSPQPGLVPLLADLHSLCVLTLNCFSLEELLQLLRAVGPRLGAGTGARGARPHCERGPGGGPLSSAGEALCPAGRSGCQQCLGRGCYDPPMPAHLPRLQSPAASARLVQRGESEHATAP